MIVVGYAEKCTKKKKDAHTHICTERTRANGKVKERQKKK